MIRRVAEDPIVEEVRRTRERLLAEAGGDLRKLAERMRELEATEGRPAIVLPPRRVGPEDDTKREK
jgi:hypothetical protein